MLFLITPRLVSMTTTTQPLCLKCLASGEGVLFPLFPKTQASFGQICADCDDTSPWLATPLACVDCDAELTEATAYGNKKWGDPQCEDCHEH